MAKLKGGTGRCRVCDHFVTTVLSDSAAALAQQQGWQHCLILQSITLKTDIHDRLATTTMSDSCMPSASFEAAHTLQRLRDYDPAHSAPASDRATGVPSAKETVGGADAVDSEAADAATALGSASNASARCDDIIRRSPLDSPESDNDGDRAPDGGLIDNNDSTLNGSSAASRGVPMDSMPAPRAVPPGSMSTGDLPMSATSVPGVTPRSPGDVDWDANMRRCCG